jgi:hypothetical protein
MERTGNARCDDSSENHGGPDRQVRLIASGYSEDDIDGTYDDILASAALDAQALALKAGEART